MSLIEAVGTTGGRLPLFVILKGKKWKDDWYIQKLEPGDRISPSKNGWTDNKLCMEWMEECSKPATRAYLGGQYRLLIVDGHASHVSSEFINLHGHIKLYVYVYHHIPQSLDVGVVGTLKQNYKKLFSEKNSFYNL